MNVEKRFKTFNEMRLIETVDIETRRLYRDLNRFISITNALWFLGRKTISDSFLKIILIFCFCQIGFSYRNCLSSGGIPDPLIILPAINCEFKRNGSVSLINWVTSGFFSQSINYIDTDPLKYPSYRLIFIMMYNSAVKSLNVPATDWVLFCHGIQRA